MLPLYLPMNVETEETSPGWSGHEISKMAVLFNEGMCLNAVRKALALNRDKNKSSQVNGDEALRCYSLILVNCFRLV